MASPESQRLCCSCSRLNGETRRSNAKRHDAQRWMFVFGGEN